VDITYASLARTSLLLAIDDTDNLTSRGTGQMVRALAQTLDELSLGTPLGVTRHQLLVDDRIPYTSHNSSACIALDCGPTPDVAALVTVAAEFLEQMSAAGSDPGLAVSALARRSDAEREALRKFGRSAKSTVVTQTEARALADATGVHLSAHGGDGGGIIGALAAIGLHDSGDDGRFLWMPRMRDLRGDWSYADLRAAVQIDAALDPSGREPAPDEVIELGDWVRPVLRGGRVVLLLDARDDEARVWTVSPRELVKAH
jgi:hypothetical protein